MKRMFTRLRAVFLIALLSTAVPIASMAQCGAGEIEYQLTTTPDGFPEENWWEIVDSEGNVVIDVACDLANTTAAFGTFTFCATIGEEYTFNAYDTFGDGWNGGTYELAYTNGVVLSSGEPDNDAGTTTFDCPGSDKETEFSWIAEELSCEPPTATVTPLCNEPGSSFDVEVDLTGGSSDTYDVIIDGTTVDAGVSTPFNATYTGYPNATAVTVEVIGDDEVCDLSFPGIVEDCTPNPLDDCGEYTSSPDLAIPDSDPAGVTDVIDVTGSDQVITDLNIGVEIEHTFVGDLNIEITSPAGTTIRVWDRGCAGENNMEVAFDDESDPVDCGSAPIFGFIAPSGDNEDNLGELSAFDGEPIAGEWTITISDNAGADTGSLIQWCLQPELEDAPACPVPYAFEATGTTGSTVTLAWEWLGDMGDATVEIGSPGFTPGNGEEIVAETPATSGNAISGLTEQTDYEAHVRFDCGEDGTSDWAGPLAFTTGCAADAAPVTYDFDDWEDEFGYVDPCWTRMPDNTNGYFWQSGFGNDGDFSAGPLGDASALQNGGYLLADPPFGGSEGQATNIMSPTVDLSALTDPTLFFDYHMFGVDINELNVDIISADGSTELEANIFTRVGNQLDSQEDDYEEAIIDLSAFAGQSIRVRFTALLGDGPDADIAIDNVTLDEAPSCISPEVTATAVCNNGLSDNFEVEVSFDGGTGTTYDVLINGDVVADGVSQPFNDTFGDYANNTSVTVTVIDENDASCEVVEDAVENCNSPINGCGEFSSSPDAFITDTEPTNDIISVGPQDPALIQSLQVAVDISHTWLADLDITLIGPNGTEVGLIFDQCGGDDNMEVLFSDDGDEVDCSGTTLVGTFVPEEPLSAFTGASIEGDWTLNVIDDVGADDGTLNQWCLIPVLTDCAPVNGLTAENIADTSADITWTNSDGNQGYEITWEPGGGSETLGTDENSYTITGLDAETEYTVNVSVICAESNSDPVSTVFETAACPLEEQCTYVLDLADSFGDGWNGNTIDVSVAGEVTNYTIDDGSALSIDIVACRDAEIILTYNASGSFNGEVSFELTDPDGNVIFSADDPADQTTFNVFACPLCPPVMDFGTTEVTNEDISLEWNETSTAESYDITWSPADGGGSANVPAGTNTYEITGLTPGETYEITITANCADDEVSMGNTITATTISCIPADQCEYTLELMDSFGDGWNGNTIDLQVGTEVTNYTISDGSSNTITFSACPGDTIRLTYFDSGTFQTEVSFELIGPDGNVVFASASPPTPGVVYDSFACPTCPNPSNLEVTNVTNEGFTISWTSGGGELIEGNNATVSYRNVDNDILCAINPDADCGSVGVPSGTMTDVTGLLYAGETYTVCVQENCTAGDGSSFEICTEVTLSSCPPEEECTYTLELLDSFGDGWNGNEIEVSVNDGSTLYTIEDGSENIIDITACPEDELNFEYLGGGTFNTEVSFNIISPEGQTLFASGTDPEVGASFSTLACPACPAPFNLEISDVTDASAMLSWTGVSAANSYTISWEPGGGSATVDATEESYMITGLDAATMYDVTVVSNCDDDLTSAELNGSFTTLACALEDRCEYTLSLFDTFGDGWNGNTIDVSVAGEVTNYTLEDGESTDIAILACPGDEITITYNNEGSFNTEVSFTFSGPYGEEFASGIEPADGTSYTVTEACPSCGPIFTADVPFIGDTDITVEWESNNPEGANYNVYVGAPGFDYTVPGEVISSTSGTTGANPQSASLDGLTGETDYDVVIFENCDPVEGDGDGTPITVSITTNNSCPDPAEFMVSAQGSTLMELSWMSQNPGANYTIYWGAPGFEIGVDELGSISGTSDLGMNTATVTGLTLATNYEFQLQEDCEPIMEGDGQSGFVSTEGTTLSIPNNACAEAIELTAGDPECDDDLYSLEGATDTYEGCAVEGGATSDREVWFTFTATSEVHTITVNPSIDLWPAIELFDGECGELTSLCCAFNGGTGQEGNAATLTTPGLTIGEEYTIAVSDVFEPGSQAFTVCIDDFTEEPCTDLTGPYDVTEAEACGEDSNASCENAENIPAPAFGETTTVGGTAFAACNLRDLDYHTITLAQETEITLEVVSEFPHLVNLFNENGCPDTPLQSFTAEECDTTSFNQVLAAGTYYMLVTPDLFAGYACGFANDYKVTVSAAEPPPSPADACGEYTSTPNLAIDQGEADVSDVITVDGTDGQVISDLDVVINLTHEFFADLDISLIAPDGTEINLITDQCGADDGSMEVRFDDESGAFTCADQVLQGQFAPEGSLSDFDGLPFDGDWTLNVVDDFAGLDVGTLISWCLIPELEDAPPAGCEEAITIAPEVTFAESQMGGSIADASPSGAEQCVDAGTPHADQWYTFTANSETMFIRGWGMNDFDAVVEVYDECGGELLACQNENGAGTEEFIILTDLEIDSDYVYRIYSAGDAPSTENYTTAVAYIPRVQLQAQSCGVMDYDLNDVIYSTTPPNFYLLTNYGYEFTELEEPFNTYEITSPGGSYPFLLSWFPQMEYGRTYEVRTRVRMYEGNHWGEYGPACIIGTGSGVPETGLHPNFQGETVNYCDLIYAQPVPNASQYNWEFSDGENVYEYTNSNYNLIVKNVPGLQPGVTYDVDVYATVGGEEGTTSSTSTLTINPDVPETALNDAITPCGETYPKIGTVMYADPVCKATSYTWRFSNTSSDQDDLIYVRTGGAYNILLNWVTGLIPGDSYDVDIYATIPGANPGEYGDVCNITIEGADPIVTQGGDSDDATTMAKSLTDVKAEVYPNPNAGDQFMLNLENLEDKEQKVVVEIYDVYGKQVYNEQLASRTSTLNTVVEFENDLAKGVYNVKVLIGENNSITRKLIVQ